MDIWSGDIKTRPIVCLIDRNEWSKELKIWAELFKAGLRQPRVKARLEFRFESLKSISVWILVVYKLMIGSSKTEKIIQENAFEYKKKKPGLSANRPSNNWAQGSL